MKVVYDAVLVDGHPDPDEAETQVVDWLQGQGHDAWDIRRARDLWSQRHTVRAWWGGDELGFVQERHPQAQPVVVVHLPARVGRD